MSRDIIKYTGSELVWSTEDVYWNAESLDIEIESLEDAVEILQNAFQNNETLMEKINEIIANEIENFYDGEQIGDGDE